MKNYTVKINTQTRPFKERQIETLGTVEAKNKQEAIKKVHDAMWGVDNDAVLIPQNMNCGAPNMDRMFAEID